MFFFFFFSSRRRHTRCGRDWSSDVCSSDLNGCSGGQRLYVQQGLQVFPGRLQIASRTRSHIATPLLAVLGESLPAADRAVTCGRPPHRNTATEPRGRYCRGSCVQCSGTGTSREAVSEGQPRGGAVPVERL